MPLITSAAYERSKSVFRPAFLTIFIFKSKELTLAMKITPPAIKPKAVNNSVGGREGNTDFGGRSHRTIYVSARAYEAPVSSVPHCLCTIDETMLSCVCELIMMPNSRMTRAGMGFVEKA